MKWYPKAVAAGSEARPLAITSLLLAFLCVAPAMSSNAFNSLDCQSSGLANRLLGPCEPVRPVNFESCSELVPGRIPGIDDQA